MSLDELSKEDIDLINDIEKQDRLKKEARKFTLFIFNLYESLAYETLLTITTAPIGDVDKLISAKLNEISGSPNCPRNISGELFHHLLSPKENWMSGLYNEFKITYMYDEDQSNNICMQYLENRENLIKLLLPNYSLVEMKTIENHLKELTKDMTLDISQYRTKYECECGVFSISHTIHGGDTRGFSRCCTRCGRSSATWKLVSGRSYTILKKIHKKYLGFINYTEDERIDCGFAPSKHMQYDPDKLIFNEYFETKPAVKKQAVFVQG